MRYAGNSFFGKKSLPLLFSVALAFIGWIIFMVSLAVAQSKVSDLFVVRGSRVFSLSWWAFAYQLFLLYIVAFYPRLSLYFSETLFTILTLYSIFLFTLILNTYIFFTKSYIRSLLAGAFIIIIVDFYWIFYFSTVVNSTLYFFPERPTAERSSEAKYRQESSQLPEVSDEHPVAASEHPVAPAAPVTPVDHHTVVPPEQNATPVTNTV